MVDVVTHERGNGEIAMIIAFIVSDLDPLFVTSLFGSSCKVLGQELALLVEVIICTLLFLSAAMLEKLLQRARADHINQDIQRPLVLLDEFGGIMFPPFVLRIFAKIARECFLAPRAFAWIGNGRES